MRKHAQHDLFICLQGVSKGHFYSLFLVVFSMVMIVFNVNRQTAVFVKTAE